jgi:hypothetical protein
MKRYEVMTRVIDASSSLGQTLLICGTIGFVAYLVYGVMIAYAGQTTVADVAITLAANLGIDRWLAYLVAGGGVGYGVRQRQLRRQNIERLAHRNTTLEQRIDPNRTSSGLTPRGTTHPRDR